MKLDLRLGTLFSLAVLFVAVFAVPALAVGVAEPMPDPDGEPADMSQPVQVFILLGQSNMVGAGRVGPADREGSLLHATGTLGLYPYLVDDEGNWTTRRDVRNVRSMGSGGGIGRILINGWMTVQGGSIGPEHGIGHVLGNAIDAPVMVLKSCIGNRSLGWDLLPPGSERYEYEGHFYAGYGETPDRWAVDSEPEPIGWTAGCQYDGDVASAKAILVELATYYPDATEYEVVGFFFWQGDKDRYNAGHATRYEQNLVRFIEALREDFDAPDAKFVCATLGQTERGAEGNEGLILEAQFAVSDPERYPAFEGEVATVYTHPISQGGASNGHYGGNARTYMDVGEAMGAAMVELLAADEVE